MLWGYANGWFPEYLTGDDDPLYAKLRFLLKHGFREMPLSLTDVSAMDERYRDALGRFLSDHDLHITPQVWYDYVHADVDEAKQREDDIVEGLRAHSTMLRNLTVFTMAGAGQRFDRGLAPEEKLRRLSERLAPLAAVCHELGTPLAINNQGDFYMADFVALCETTPQLYLHVDTSNIFWAGEPIFPAFELAAPYIVGTHWRDEICVLGSRQPRGVLLENCVTGEGDVPLRRCFDVLRKRAPAPDRLVMELELFPPKGADRLEAIEKAVSYLRTLPGVEL